MLLTGRQAAEVLGVDQQSVYLLTYRGKIQRHSARRGAPAYDLAELETFMLSQLRYHHSGHHYFVTAAEAAEALGTTAQVVRNLMAAEKMPSLLAPNGRRYVRRHQLDTYANARDLRGIAVRGVK